jgi:hypothetical protein
MGESTRLALALLLSLSVSAFAVGQSEEKLAASRTASWAVEPGVAIGPVRLGMKSEEVNAAIGDATKSDRARLDIQAW